MGSIPPAAPLQGTPAELAEHGDPGRSPASLGHGPCSRLAAAARLHAQAIVRCRAAAWESDPTIMLRNWTGRLLATFLYHAVSHTNNSTQLEGSLQHEALGTQA